MIQDTPPRTNYKGFEDDTEKLQVLSEKLQKLKKAQAERYLDLFM